MIKFVSVTLVLGSLVLVSHVEAKVAVPVVARPAVVVPPRAAPKPPSTSQPPAVIPPTANAPSRPREEKREEKRP